MSEHSPLGPSSASRWLACPASVRESMGIEDKASAAADEGTRAHAVAEQKLRNVLRGKTNAGRLGEFSALADPEMDEHTTAYVNYVADLANRDATVWVEERVDTGIPGVWGTADAIVFDAVDEVLHVIDFKYGAGVFVDVEDNTQMKLYALGALSIEDLPYVSEVALHVFQPRMNNIDEWWMTPDELERWRDEIAPVAADALAGSWHYNPSDETCRWCPARVTCPVRRDWSLTQAFGTDLPEPVDVDPEELGELLTRCERVLAYAKDLREYVSERVADGTRVPGWKRVLPRSQRRVLDPERAIGRLISSGYAYDDVVKPGTIQPFGTLDRVVGKDRLPDVLGDTLGRTDPKPVLVPEDDPREAYSPATEAKRVFSEDEYHE